MATNKEKKEKKTQTLKEIEELFQSPFPIMGDLEDETYNYLVHEGNQILYGKLFGTNKKTHHLNYYATCCRAFGEKGLLLSKGHLEHNLKSIGRTGDIKIESKTDLLKFILSNQQDDAIGMVQYPRTVIRCTKKHPEEPMNHPADLSYRNSTQTSALFFTNEKELGKRKREKALLKEAQNTSRQCVRNLGSLSS